MFNATLYMGVITVIQKCMARSGVLESLYSIGSFKEDAVCIERNFDKGQTVVYDGGANGEKSNIVIYNNPVIAAGEFIDRVYDLMDVEREKYIELLSRMDECDEDEYLIGEDDIIDDID